MPQFYTILTDVGQAKIANALALGQTINITELAVGDGGGSLPTPDSSATTLVNEVRRAPINTSHVDSENPTWIVVEQVLPPDVGGWTIREIGVYDVDGDLIGIGNYPETYKPILSEGSSRTQTVRFVMEVSDTSAVTLKVDPSVVLATRQYVDQQRAEHEQDPEAHSAEQITIVTPIPQAPAATNVGEALAALGDFAADGYQNIAVFDTAGTTDWPVPQVLKDGHRKAHVMVIGGGGGGAAGDLATPRLCGGGGGGGGLAIGLIDLNGVTSVSVTVGAGGAGSTSGEGDPGGTSSFGAFMSATGGGTFSHTGGPSGVGAGGYYNTGLGPGGARADGREISGASSTSGGGGGPGGEGRYIPDGVGRDGVGPGGGGSGSVDGFVGGDGANGIVIVRY